MTPQYREHSENVKALLSKLDLDRIALLDMYHSELSYDGAPIFPLDILANGAVKRVLSSTSAFKLMIETWNLISARTLLRTHIDTALRFSAAWLVDSPHDFATKVIAGERINKMKDRKGKQLTDAYLVDVLSMDNPWMPKAYSELSGYIHFSGSHVSATVSECNEDSGAVSFRIADVDYDFPESSWLEVIECFRAATQIFAHYVHGYALTKRATPEQLSAVQSSRWRLAVPPAVEALRTHQRHHHNQPQLRRMVERVRRCKDDHGAAGPTDSPLSYRRNRERIFPFPAKQHGCQRAHQGQGAKVQGWERSIPGGAVLKIALQLM